MKCPVCKIHPLERQEIESGLISYHCNNCNGNWIRFQEYDEWNKNSVNSEVVLPNSPEYAPEYDSKQPNFCPDCGQIISKYKVSGKIPFFVDHCGGCNGVWLDKSEWENLIKNNLHHHINEFFTSPWQRKLKEEMSAQRFEEHYKKKFGEENYLKLKSIREWIQNSGLKTEMIAFIIDDDPYRL